MRTTTAALLMVLFLGTSVARADSESYWTAKAGPLFFLGDADDFDPGLNLSLAYGFKPVKFLGLELESGYFWGEDPGSAAAELWGVPMLANAKLSLPILFFEVYAGVGVGGFYLNSEAGSRDDDDWAFGGDAFLGADFELGPVGIGAELKYLISEEADLFGSRDQFEGIALMAALSLSF